MRSVSAFLLPVVGVLVLVAAAAPAQDEAPKLVGPFSKDEYPQAVIDRPLTLPAGMVEGEVGGQFTSVRFDPPVFGVGGTDDWNADVALRVGVTDRFQVEAGTSFSLDHELRDGERFFGLPPQDLRPNLSSWQRIVPLRLSLLALDTETLDTAVTLTLPFVAHSRRTLVYPGGRGSGPRVVTQNSDGRVLPEVDLAAPTRWRLNDWLWLRAGENLFAVTTGSGVALFTFDFGLGVQPHRMLALTLDSRIASIAFDGDGHEASQTLDERGTLAVQAVFAPLSRFDVVGGLFLPDVARGSDDYSLRIAFRVRI